MPLKNKIVGFLIMAISAIIVWFSFHILRYSVFFTIIGIFGILVGLALGFVGLVIFSIYDVNLEKLRNEKKTNTLD